MAILGRLATKAPAAKPSSILHHPVPLKTCNCPLESQTVHQIINPAARFNKELHYAKVLRGANKSAFGMIETLVWHKNLEYMKLSPRYEQTGIPLKTITIRQENICTYK